MIKIIECVVGQEPQVKEINGTLEESQLIVGGYIEGIYLINNVYIFCNEDARRLKLPMNRKNILGNFMITKSDKDGNPVSLDKLEIEAYLQWLSC